MPPVALVTSIVGLVVDRSKGFALGGLAVSGLTCLLYTLPVFCF